MTKAELREIRQAIIEAHGEIAAQNEEVWLSKDEFLKQFQMFTEDWLRNYGHSLKRTRAFVTDEKGERHKTSWAYARNETQRMIQTGEIAHLRCLCVNLQIAKAV